MPKRTNDFQKLVYLVRVNLAAGYRHGIDCIAAA
jgi:hypothetical protein